MRQVRYGSATATHAVQTALLQSHNWYLIRHTGPWSNRRSVRLEPPLPTYDKRHSIRILGEIALKIFSLLPSVWIGVGLLVASPSAASSGGLNAQGCHNDRKGGTGYHRHNRSAKRAGASSRALPVQGVEGRSSYFANCSAARAAGAAPVRAGAPGYSRKLDRDGDGIGCER